jgi:hypothetical protein
MPKYILYWQYSLRPNDSTLIYGKEIPPPPQEVPVGKVTSDHNIIFYDTNRAAPCVCACFELSCLTRHWNGSYFARLWSHLKPNSKMRKNLTKHRYRHNFGLMMDYVRYFYFVVTILFGSGLWGLMSDLSFWVSYFMLEHYGHSTVTLK